MKTPTLMTMTIAALTSLSAAVGGKTVTTVSPKFAEELGCPKFGWAAIPGLSDKAAMKIPVQINGKSYKYQLDTGAHVSFAPANEAKRRGWRSVEADQVDVRFLKIAGTAIPPTRMRLSDDGTVGLDLLLGMMVIIDYPRQRICVLTRDKVPVTLEGQVDWQRASLHYGKLFVPVRLGSDLFNGAFFDTGSSMFPLNVDAVRWRALTGKEDPAKAEHKLEVPSWGKMVPLQGAATRIALKVGSVEVSDAVVYTNPSDPTFFRDKIGGGAEGLIGNAMFFDKVVVLDLSPSMRFGIFKESNVQK